MKATVRTARFLAIGWLGFVVQIAAIGALTALAHWPWLPATCVAVEASIVHNYLWHERWTWGDRACASVPAPRVVRFAKYNAATGLVAIVGNVGLTALYLSLLTVPAVVANALSVVTLTIVNVVVADRWIFTSLFVAVAALVAPRPAAAQPSRETIQAWDGYVAQMEARIEHARAANAPPSFDVSGDTVDVPGGAIHHWRGSVFVAGVTLDRMLDSLLRGTCRAGGNGAQVRAREGAERALGAPRATEPGCGAEPHLSDDVAESRTIARTDDSVRTYIRLVRRAIVTVSYDTEHEMTFRRWTPALAAARSVATSIREVGGDDHGFLWRLNSYWRYRQVAGGVVVELESITLSRSIPTLVRPIAMPIIHHIARESMTRTLDAFRSRFRADG